MEKINEKIRFLSAKVASAMIEHDSDEWPPVCSLFAYQPVHPLATKKDDADQDITE